MNIAWISSSMPNARARGGFGIQGGNLIPLLTRRHRVDLISLVSPDDTGHTDWVKQYCARVETIPVRRFGFVQRAASFASGYLRGRYLNHAAEIERLLWSGLKSRSWDVLHIEGGFVAGLIPRGLPVPKVLAVHDAEVLRCQELLRCKLSLRARLRCTIQRYYEPRYERRVYPRFDHCVMVAERDMLFNQELVPKARFSFIPYGIDTNYFHPQPATKVPFSLVFHGNLNYIPNVEAASALE